MAQNGVIETATGDLLRAGFSDFLNDGSFNAGTESYRTDVPFPGKVRYGGDANMHRWSGSEWVEVTAPPPIPHGEAWQEIPSGTIDGANNVFTLAQTPLGVIMFFCNGFLLEEGSGNDYQISGKTITFESGSTPQTGDKLLTRYTY